MIDKSLRCREFMETMEWLKKDDQSNWMCVSVNLICIQAEGQTSLSSVMPGNVDVVTMVAVFLECTTEPEPQLLKVDTCKKGGNALFCFMFGLSE